MCILFAHKSGIFFLFFSALFTSAELGALDLCPKLVSAQYLVKELMDYDHILRTYIC